MLGRKSNTSGVFVVGMHRSGTSAAVLCLEALGLNLCVDEDRLGDALGNADHGESLSVIAKNDDLLELFGASWLHPNLRSNWAKDAKVRSMREEAKEVFGWTHPETPWACKDPRICLTLPFWEESLGAKPMILLVLRNPLEIAKSLKNREAKDEYQRTIKFYLALWERYMRQALENSKRHNVLCIAYDDLLNDWAGHQEKMMAWLSKGGIEVSPQAAKSPVNKSLRHNHSKASLDRLSKEQKRLYAALNTLKGEHGSLHIPRLGRESNYTTKLFRPGVDEITKAYSLRRLMNRFKQISTPTARQKLYRGFTTTGVLVMACIIVLVLLLIHPIKSGNAWISTALSNISLPVLDTILKFDYRLFITGGALAWLTLALAAVALFFGRRLPSMILIVGLLMATGINAILGRVGSPLGTNTGELVRAVILLGLISFLIVRQIDQRGVRRAIIIIALAMAVTLAVTQVYVTPLTLGMVIAVILLGLAFAAIPVTLCEALARPSKQHTIQADKR